MGKENRGCTYPGKKGEEVVLLVVDDISRVSLVPLLGVSQPDSTGPGLPSTAASQPLTAPTGKKVHKIRATPTFYQGHTHVIKATLTSKPHSHLPTHLSLAHACPLRVTPRPNLHHHSHTHTRPTRLIMLLLYRVLARAGLQPPNLG